jgi:hypothetical protein
VSWFALKNPPMPWGDYGSILWSGMTGHLGRDAQGRLQLERTGPFVPGIFVSGLREVLVTGAFRARLERSGLRGARFGPVALTRIVELDWEHWDRDADDPAIYPSDGEPEGYILGRPHSEETARRMGPVWEVLGAPADEAAQADVVQLPEDGGVLFSERARGWMQANVPFELGFRSEDLAPD